jgi:modulator of FtsH protease
MGLWTLLPFFLFLWLTEKNKNSAMGLVWVFALTGWLGFSLGPIIGHYLQTSGVEPVLTALGGTALIFFACSAYVLTTRNNLGFMTVFLMTGIIVAFVAAIANYFLQIQGLNQDLRQFALLVCQHRCILSVHPLHLKLIRGEPARHRCIR